MKELSKTLTVKFNSQIIKKKTSWNLLESLQGYRSAYVYRVTWEVAHYQ